MASDNDNAKLVATLMRAEECMRAMEGIPDPAAFVEAARKVVEPNSTQHKPRQRRGSKGSV